MRSNLDNTGFFGDFFNPFLIEKIENVASGVMPNIKKEIEVIKEGFHCKFIFYPLSRGMGTSMGNLLRRILLGHMDGYAIAAIKISGVKHMFDSLKGVREDVIDIIMNLKHIGIKYSIPEFEEINEEYSSSSDEEGFIEEEEKKPLTEPNSCSLSLNVQERGEIFARDIICPDNFTITTPDKFICYLEGSTKLKIDMLVVKGKGYVFSEDYNRAWVENEEDLYNNKGEFYILTDSIFNGVERVSFNVEKERVGYNMDCDKLIIEVETNGSITPEEAIEKAIDKIMENIVALSFRPNLLESLHKKEEGLNSDLPFPRIMFNTIHSLNLPVRAFRGLVNLDVLYIGDLVIRTQAELLSINSVGRKSLNSIEDALLAQNLSLGMKLEGWPPQNLNVILSKLNKNDNMNNNNKQSNVNSAEEYQRMNRMKKRQQNQLNKKEPNIEE